MGRLAIGTLLAAGTLTASSAGATEVAVSFRDAGYGTFAGSQLQNIGSPASLLAIAGISKVEFVQNTASGRFEVIQTGCDAQGNDVAVTVRLTADGTLINNVQNGVLSFLACVNWLDQPGGKIEGFGFMMPIGATPFVIDSKSGTDVTLSRTSKYVGTNMFADLIGGKTYPFTGTASSSFIGSANFKPSSLVSALNTYLDATSVPSLELVKTGVVNGSQIDYTYAVTNTGNIDLDTVAITEITSVNTDSYAGSTPFSGQGTAPVPVIDTVNSPDYLDNILQSGETVYFTASYTIDPELDVNGSITNQAVASALTPADATVTDLSDDNGSGSDPTVTALGEAPEFTITKLVDESALADGVQAGDVLLYTIEVENTGNVTLSNVTLSDNLTDGDATVLSLTSGPSKVNDTGTITNDTTMDVGDIWTYEASLTLSDAIIATGGVENIAEVTGTSPQQTSITAQSSDTGNTDSSGTATATALDAPEMTVTKTADTTGLSTPARAGDKIAYTIEVENTGNVPLTNLSIADELTGPPTYVSGDLNEDETLDVGELWTYEIVYPLTQANLDAGKVENLAVASATPPSGVEDRFDVESSAAGNATPGADNGTPTESLLTAAGEFTITKTVDDSDLDDGFQTGDKLDYTITVVNTGNVTLSDVVLTDTPSDDLSLDAAPTLLSDTGTSGDDVLGVGDVWTFTASITLTRDIMALGTVTNVADVTGKTPGGDAVSAQSSTSGNNDDSGGPTETPFAGQIEGTVRGYLTGVAGVEVYLLDETGARTGRMVVTDADGNYSFTGLEAGIYGVEFVDPDGGEPSAASPNNAEEGNRIIGIEVAGGTVEIEQDAFLIDPSGVVYDSETFDPISGATVRLYRKTGPDSQVEVSDADLDLSIGNASGMVTGANGAYSFFLKSTAPSGTYTIVVEKAGFNFSSKRITPAGVLYTPGTGGGVEEIVPEATPNSSATATYYLAFDLTVGATPALSSKGIVHNHIPMDAALLPEVEDDLRRVLRDDLAATMTQQGQAMAGYAANALKRLKDRDPSACAAAVDEALTRMPVLFHAQSSDLTANDTEALDKIAALLASCENAEFEVVGHSDAAEGSDAALPISRARAKSVVDALAERGVDRARLVAKAVGSDQPASDEASEEAQALNRRVEFRLIAADGAGDACRDGSRVSRGLDANAGADGTHMEGTFNHETRDCANDAWRILSGRVSYLANESGVSQGMVNLAWRNERFKSENEVAGRFIGAYASTNDVTGLATGEIKGFGLNAGIYGARQMQSGLYLDYYMGAAAGRHTFGLDFNRPRGVTRADGHYDYFALFLGSAISTETSFGAYKISPRFGFDAAWSPGGEADVTVSRAGLEETGGLSTGSVSGLRIFGELEFADLLLDQPELLSFTPQIFCDRPIGDLESRCGIGAKVELSHEDLEDGSTYSILLSGEASESHEAYSLGIEYSQPALGGRISGSGTVGQDGDVGVAANYALKF